MKVVLHISKTSVLPFWEDGAYRSFLDWLRSNKNIDQYRSEQCHRNQVSLKNLGAIRPLGKARLFGRKIWRHITTNYGQPEIAHVIPLRLAPPYHLQMQRANIWVRKFFVYLTPHTTSTHLMLGALTSDLPDFVRNRRSLSVCLSKPGFRRKLRILKAIDFVDEQVRNAVLTPESYRIRVIPPTTLTSVGIMGRRVSVEEARNLFEEEGAISSDAKALSAGSSGLDWKIIDRHISIIQSTLNQRHLKRRRLCHFNNWSDLTFLYFSLLAALRSAKQHMDKGGTIGYEERTRLVTSCTVIEHLLFMSHWSTSLTALASLYGQELSIQKLRDDLRSHAVTYQFTKLSHWYPADWTTQSDKDLESAAINCIPQKPRYR